MQQFADFLPNYFSMAAFDKNCEFRTQAPTSSVHLVMTRIRSALDLLQFQSIPHYSYYCCCCGCVVVRRAKQLKQVVPEALSLVPVSKDAHNTLFTIQITEYASSLFRRFHLVAPQAFWNLIAANYVFSILRRFFSGKRMHRCASMLPHNNAAPRDSAPWTNALVFDGWIRGTNESKNVCQVSLSSQCHCSHH